MGVGLVLQKKGLNQKLTLLCIKHDLLKNKTKKEQDTPPVLCDLVQTASAAHNFIILGMPRIKTCTDHFPELIMA